MRATADGYTGGASAFMDGYYKQLESPNYNGTMTFRYRSGSSAWTEEGTYYGTDENGKSFGKLSGTPVVAPVYRTVSVHIGDPSNGRNWLGSTQIGMESYGLVNSSKEKLFEYASRSDKSINNLKYVKGVKVVGKVLVITSAAVTIYETYNDAVNKGNYYSAGTRASVYLIGLAATAIPVVGWGVAGGIGLADAIWGDKFYGWVELQLSK